MYLLTDVILSDIIYEFLIRNIMSVNGGTPDVIDPMLDRLVDVAGKSDDNVESPIVQRVKLNGPLRVALENLVLRLGGTVPEEPPKG